MIMKTLRRNTNDYKRAFKKMVNVREYRLENDFRPKFVGTVPGFAVDAGKLLKMLDHYRLQVNSNLWYEWTAA